jgi:hypothetical protein
MTQSPPKYSALTTRVEIATFNFAILYYLEDLDIVELEYQANSTINKEEAIQIVSALKKFLKGEQKYFLVNSSQDFINISSEARTFYANEHRKNKYGIRMAIFVNSLAYRIIANFFIQFNNPPMPTRVFSSRKKAINWILKN